PGEGRRHVGPGVETMPGQIEIVQHVLAKRADAEAWENALKIAPVQHIELAERNAAGTHFFHGALILPTPSIGHRQPIKRVATRLEQCLRFTRHPAAPVDQRAKHIEEEGFYLERHACTLRLPYQSTGDQPQARKMSDFERWEKRYGAAGHVF